MSQGLACKCPRTHLEVVTRRGNYSAFSGYKFTSSAYSAVRCRKCGAAWRTDAAYVSSLPDADGEEMRRFDEQKTEASRELRRVLPLGTGSPVCVVHSLGTHEPRENDPARCRHCGLFIPESASTEIECGNCGSLHQPEELVNCIHCTQQLCSDCEFEHMSKEHGEV